MSVAPQFSPSPVSPSLLVALLLGLAGSACADTDESSTVAEAPGAANTTTMPQTKDPAQHGHKQHGDQARHKQHGDQAGHHKPGHGQAGHPNTEHGGHRHEGGHHRFEDAEKWAKVFDDPERDAWQKPDAVITWLKLSPDSVVADIGAGTGYFSVRFAAAVPQGKVIANDVEASMVSYLEERSKRDKLDNLVATLGTGAEARLGTKVDVAFICDVYHHIEDRPAYFSALAKELEHNGRLVIVDFAPDAPDDAPGPPKAMRVAPDQVAAELAKAGFKLSRSEHTLLPYQYILEFELAAS